MVGIIGFVGFIIGTILGSFIKVLADRSLKNQNFGGRSYCLNCKNKLQWYDLLPVLSYLLLKGRCRYCHKKIGIEHLLVEVGLGLLIGYLFYLSFKEIQFPTSNFTLLISNFQFLFFLLDLIFKTFFISVLVALFLTDLKKMLIPDRIILPSILISIIFITVITIIKIIYLYFALGKSSIGHYLLPPYSDYFQKHTLLTAEPLFGAVISGLIIGGFFYSLIVITKGKGMGGGDVKLGAFMGLVLGFPQSFLALILSFFTGAAFAIFLLFLGKKKMGQVIPFGPFLVLGSLITLFWGDKILDWYLHISI